MLTIHELLEDGDFKKYFLTIPRMPAVRRTAPPWRLYVQKERHGSWAKKDFDDYKDAVKAFARLKKQGLSDASITCRSIAFPPPVKVVRVKGRFHTAPDGTQTQVTKEIVWKPLLPADEVQHRWCPYCRRPTVFTYFSSHHMFRGELKPIMDHGAQRCTICGIRLEGLGHWAKL